ncbi:MAG: helix-turn-helix domain-containing protein [Acidimicrobiales bacterium]
MTTRSEWIAPGLAQVFELVLDAADDQRDLTIGEREEIFATGEAAHGTGGSLSQLIEAYLAGAAELWENVFGATEPGMAVEVGRTLRRVSENAVAGLASGFEAAQRRSIQAEEALRREVIHELLTGRGDVTHLEERARLAAIPAEPVQLVLVAESATALSELGPVHERVQVEIRSRAPGREMTTFVTAGQLVVIAPTASPAELRVVELSLAALDTGAWRCGVGRPSTSLAEIHRSYDDAREALRLSRIFGLDEFAVFDSLLAHRMLAADPVVAAALVDSVLSPLVQSRRGDLLETLASFVAHGGNMAAVARDLSLGSRSVAYRLDRIAELTGYSLRDPDGRLTLELALRCRPLVDPGG